MESNTQYEQRSLSEAHRREEAINSESLSGRKEASQEFYQAMAERPELVGERIGWLINGDYGYGEMMRAKQVLAQSKRANKRASLTHLVGLYEWQCPVAFAIKAWKRLTKSQQERLDAVLDIVIAEAGKED